MSKVTLFTELDRQSRST